MRRRDFFGRVAGSLAVLAGGCSWRDETPEQPGTSHLLIDAHCHVFNASDLPATRFLRQVVFEDFPKQAYDVMRVRDPDVTDRFIELILSLLASNKAPDAEEEIAYLKGQAKLRPSAENAAEAQASSIEDTARFLIKLDRRMRERKLETMGNGVSAEADSRRVGDAKFLDFFVGPQLQAKRLDMDPMTLTEARAASRRAFTERGAISRYLRWFSLFRLYRHVLVDRLIEDSSRQGFKVELLTPALVDYDEWLFEDVTKSPLPMQMKVMDQVSRRPDRPALHCYMGFDPLREVAYRAGADGATISSLETTRQALSEHGFIGVKLYPPTGFRASGNKGPYPRRTKERLGFTPDRELDKALDDLYQLCVDLDAPILAHGYASNGSGPDYANRADPKYWLPVFERQPELRVCLAHFGRFDKVSEGRENLPLPEASWEWALGSFIKEHPNQPIFADISYFSEVLDSDPKVREQLASLVKRWTREFDPKLEHLIFGSDWIMLGQERGYEHYLESVNSFLRDSCGFNDETRERIFRGNALNFLPLQRNSRGRQRLLAWYVGNGLDPQRLPVAPSSFRLFRQWQS